MRHRNVLGGLEKLVVDHPNRERLVGLQMIALYRSGRQADALRAYERYRRTVGDELGILPSPELRHVQEQVLLHDEQLAPAPTAISVDVAPLATNPFKGLRYFTEEDAATFFGRERVTDDLVGRIESGSSLLALVGASGSGKSSVLRAGLVPRLSADAIGDSGDWLVAQMNPGARPFLELEASLYRAVPDAPTNLHDLLHEEDGILRACLRLRPRESARIVLVIDQFEELFTLAPRDEQARFIRELEVVLDDGRGQVVVAIGLRADFYGGPLEYPRFAQLLGHGIVNVVPLTLEELESAAQRPAAIAGVSLEPSLVVQLLADVAGQVGGLPLFQYALTELFDRREASTLTLDGYEQMGGVNGALARRAESVHQALSDEEQAAAKQLFLRLVTVFEQGAWGRRRVVAAEIAAIAADVVVLQTVLDRFGTHRLLTLDRDPVTESPTVEVAHEALLNEWPRLRQWIDDGQKDVRRRARLATALAEWTASGANDDYLVSGERLADYERWAAISTLKLSRDEERFLDASILQREQERMAEEERQAREVKLDRQARRRLWGIGVGASLVASAVAGVVLITPNDTKPVVALVHGVGGDLGITDMMIQGVGASERDHDLEVDLVEPLVDPQDDLRRLAEAGTDLIIVGSEFDFDVDGIAADYPDVQWVAVDPIALHLEAPNISEMHFSVEDSAFVAGAAAALMSQTGEVGFIGAYQSFRSERSRNGFEQGAQWADPGIEVNSMFLGPVADPLVTAETRDDLAHELATTMYANGADVIFHDAGEAGAGVIRAAREWSDGNDHVWTIGSDADEYLTASPADREFVLTSTIKRFDTAVEMAIDRYLDGELESGDTLLGLGEDGVALSRSGEHLASIDGQLRNLEDEVGFDHLFVSPNAIRPPGWQLEPDVTIELVVTDDQCVVKQSTAEPLADGHLRLERGSVVMFDMTNASAELGTLSIRSVTTGATTAELDRQGRGQIPDALGAIQAITTAEPGSRTSSAVVAARTPMVATCILGVPDATPTASYHPVIVSPT
jgi:basic membrane lipoprotein Med (substrate-binding protein (PBP1-ABC) superfamily)